MLREKPAIDTDANEGSNPPAFVSSSVLRSPSSVLISPSSVLISPSSVPHPNRLAFVYPGLGNQFAGMGRALSALWPDVLDAQDLECGYLREQLDPLVWWQDPLPREFANHREPILGSVSVAAVVTDVLRGLGVRPDAAIGYSLGESAALVSLRAWTDRDEMLPPAAIIPPLQDGTRGPVRCGSQALEDSLRPAGRLGRWDYPAARSTSFARRWET